MRVFNLAEELEKERKKNKELKELCDKYEEEHNTKFNEWVFDKRENERLTRTIVDYDELLLERNNRIDKAIEYIEIVKGFNEEYKDDWEFKVFIPHLLGILEGSDNNE